MKRKVLAYIPINLGGWKCLEKTAYGGPRDKVWFNLYFLEQVINWKDLPPNCVAKLMVEFKDGIREFGKQKGEGKVGVRLAIQQKRNQWIPIKGSEIFSDGGERWQLGESDWFKLPRRKGLWLIWIQGMQTEGSRCCVALANIVIAEESK